MAYTPGFELVAKGTIRTHSAGVGIWGWRFHQIDREVQKLVDRYEPQHIGFEAPWVPIVGKDAKAAANALSARFLICIAGKFEEIAARNGLECSEVVPATAKKALTGSGRLKGTTKEQKQQMIAACVARDWLVADEHQADAIAVGMVCVDNYLRGR